MNFQWKKLVDKLIFQHEESPFYQAVFELSKRTYGIPYDEREDFAQYVCLMIWENNITRKYIKLSNNSVIHSQIKRFISWKKYDWYRMTGRIKAREDEFNEDLHDKEDVYFSQLLFRKEIILTIRGFIKKIIPFIKESNLRTDAKESTIKVFLLSKIFLGEIVEDYNSDTVLGMLETDLTEYEIELDEVGQFTIEEISERLNISTTTVTNANDRIRETGKCLAKDLNLNYSSAENNF